MTVGAAVVRRDSLDKVTGAAAYPGDLRREAMLHARVVFTGKPHARITRLDVSGALETPGVLEVLTAADVPVNEYGLTMFDQPVFIGPVHTARSHVPCDISRWEADHLALVIAETPEAATAGALAIVSEWDDLPVVSDIDSALRGPLLHAENGRDSNEYYHLKVRKGDMDAGWAAAEVTVEGTYDVPYQEHAFLQPEAGLSYFDDERRLTVEAAGQWTIEDQGQIAHALDLPKDQIRVIYPVIGGAFGGREDTSIQIVLALAATKLRARGINRPVRIQWSREESIVGHHKRHRARIHAKWGATSDGRIVAVEADAYLDAGGYNYTSNKVLGNLHVCLAGPYEVSNVRIDSRAIYTNAIPGGAFRGFGAPQAAFVAESQINKLADALDIDPVELRLFNCLRDGSLSINQAELPDVVSLPTVIKGCADAAAWADPLATVGEFAPFMTLNAEKAAVRRGRGFGCAFKNVGFSFGFPERCDAIVELHGDDEIEQAVLYHGGADVGQGAHTVMAQMAAEAAGIDIDRVETKCSDTATSGDSGSASASRMTWMAGNSILGAVEEAQKKWNDGDRPAIGSFRFVPPPTQALDPDTGAGDHSFAYGYVAEAVEVSVDIETGHIRVDRVVCADDVGRAINPDLVVGQIEGAVVQAQGYAISENLVVEEGRTLSSRLSTYLMPGIGDIPSKVESVILEVADPRGPWGARGMGEMPLIPFAPALAAALHDATGVWFDRIPLTPDRVIAALNSKIGDGAHEG
jgi:CO/xanthine dehydrogenase Mo-binding subunit